MVDKLKFAMANEPIFIANEPKKDEEWAMECTLRYERIEKMGDGEVTSELEWIGFATGNVVDAMLELFRREVDECSAR